MIYKRTNKICWAMKRNLPHRNLISNHLITARFQIKYKKGNLERA